MHLGCAGGHILEHQFHSPLKKFPNTALTIFPPPTDTMTQLPLTDPFFSTENENNITVDEEEIRPHPQTDKLVSITPHMPRWRRDDGEMVCVTPHLLPHTLTREQRRVLLGDMLPLPSQDTTHQGGGLDLLVCAPRLRPCGVQILSGTVLRSLARNEEWTEVVCVDGGGERTSQSVLHHTSNKTEPSSEEEICFGVMDISEHSPHYYIPPQQMWLPLETASTCVFIGPNINFSYSCMDVEVECTHNSGELLEDEEYECNMIAEENATPHTQQWVTGQTVTHEGT